MNCSKIFREFRDSLCNILGIIKLDYLYYDAIHTNLLVIINKIEEVILFLYNVENENNNNNNIEDDRKLFELFYILFTIETNTTFYDIFFNLFHKFLKKLETYSLNIQETHFKTYQQYYIQIYEYLIHKKLDYIGVESDLYATINLSKVLSKLFYLFNKFKLKNEKIKRLELLGVFFQFNHTIFSLSKGNYSYKNFNKIFIDLFKYIFENPESKEDINTLAQTILYNYRNIKNKR